MRLGSLRNLTMAKKEQHHLQPTRVYSVGRREIWPSWSAMMWSLVFSAAYYADTDMLSMLLWNRTLKGCGIALNEALHFPTRIQSFSSSFLCSIKTLRLWIKVCNINWNFSSNLTTSSTARVALRPLRQTSYY